MLVRIGLGAILLGVPVEFFPGAVGPYEDGKGWGLQILVGGTLVAWVLARAMGGTASPPALATKPGRCRWLPWIVVAYGGWWVVTTLASVAPGQSVWGGFARGHGLLTVLAAVALFPLSRAGCRAPADAWALVDLALLGSVPVSLLAIGQALGWDPLPRPWDPAIVTLVIRSTFGQHIFLGSYFVLLVPLGVARLDLALRARRAPPASASAAPRPGPWRLLVPALWIAGAVAIVAANGLGSVVGVALVVWGVLGAAAWWLAHDRARGPATGTGPVALVGALLVLQGVVVVISRARGPLLGLLAGLAVTGAMLLVRRRAWRSLAAFAAVLAAVVLFVVLLNVADSPLAPLRNMHLFSRLSRLTATSPRSPGWVRRQLWLAVGSGWRRQLSGEEVVADSWPRLRSLVGFGLDVQLYSLDRMARPFLGRPRAGRRDTPMRYGADRTHNELLEHVVTGGLVGATLWLIAVGGILLVGIARIRASAAASEATLRLGCLGAVVAHLVEAQVGVTTPMPRALFWLAAGLLTSPPPPGADAEGRRQRARATRLGWRRAAPALASAIAVLVLVWGSTRWLLGSAAYARGVRHTMAGQTAEALREFETASRLAPWIPLTAEAVAEVSLVRAAQEPDPARRADILARARDRIAQVGSHVRSPAFPWTSTGQLALAQARGGDGTKLAEAREAFAAAVRQQPHDPRVLAYAAMAALEAGEPLVVHELARRATELDGREWLGWAMLARAAALLGDPDEARRAGARARRAAPPEAMGAVERLLR